MILNTKITSKVYVGHEFNTINSLCLIEPTSIFVTGGTDSIIKLHTDDNLLNLPKEHNGSINGIDYFKDNLISVSSDGQLINWDLVKQKKKLGYAKSKDDLTSCAKLNDRLWCCGGYNHRLYFYDSRVSKSFYSMNIGKDIINDINYKDQDVIGISNSDGCFYQIDLRNSNQIIDEYNKGSIMSNYYNDTLQKDLLFFENGDLVIDSFSISTFKRNYKYNAQLIDYNGNHWIIAGNQSKIDVWNYQEGYVDSLANNLVDVVSEVKFNKYGNQIIGTSSDKVVIWQNVF